MAASSPSRARSRARKLEASPLAVRSLTLVWPGGNVSGLKIETALVRTSVKLVERWESVRHFGMVFSALSDGFGFSRAVDGLGISRVGGFGFSGVGDGLVRG
jgi:hypothetical protein